jgi:hypothetical protein
MRRRGTRNALSRQISEGGGMTALLAAVWLLLDYPWGLAGLRGHRGAVRAALSQGALSTLELRTCFELPGDPWLGGSIVPSPHN